MITVMFSSANGGDELARTLDSLSRVRAPEGGWKLIGVDNASTDDTLDVLHSYSDRLPITVLSEPQKGKNRALNRALDLAEGDLFIFCDDDVLMDQDWLIKWREIADAQPDYDLFAGATKPHWPYEPPDWILSEVQMGIVFAAHVGMPEGLCNATTMHGTNMAIRSKLFANGERFNTAIGPDGSTTYAMGSETDIALRLEKNGAKCWFASGPVVEHIILPDQMKANWILRRGYRWGRGQAKTGFRYKCSLQQLSLKNSIKAILYPILLPAFPKKSRWQRRWQSMIDRGIEDGTREALGRKPVWMPTK